MDHTVIYRWRLREGRETEFEAAWSEGTRQIRERCGSGGAELYSGPDGVYYSLARWPSPESRDECSTHGSWENETWRDTMRACIDERLPEIPLHKLVDLRKGDKEHHSVPTLQTERLLLRPMELADAEHLAPALMDDGNMRYWSRGPLDSVAAVREYITWNVVPAGLECFAITERTDPSVALGWVILIDRDKDVAEVGFILRPDAQGRGLARESLLRAISHAFDTRCLRRLYADIDPDNHRSRGLVEALGFAYEGHLRGTWVTHLGLRDTVLYGLLASDRVE